MYSAAYSSSPKRPARSSNNNNNSNNNSTSNGANSLFSAPMRKVILTPPLFKVLRHHQSVDESDVELLGRAARNVVKSYFNKDCFLRCAVNVQPDDGTSFYAKFQHDPAYQILTGRLHLSLWQQGIRNGTLADGTVGLGLSLHDDSVHGSVDYTLDRINARGFISGKASVSGNNPSIGLGGMRFRSEEGDVAGGFSIDPMSQHLKTWGIIKKASWALGGEWEYENKTNAWDIGAVGMSIFKTPDETNKFRGYEVTAKAKYNKGQPELELSCFNRISFCRRLLNPFDSEAAAITNYIDSAVHLRFNESGFISPAIAAAWQANKGLMLKLLLEPSSMSVGCIMKLLPKNSGSATNLSSGVTTAFTGTWDAHHGSMGAWPKIGISLIIDSIPACNATNTKRETLDR